MTSRSTFLAGSGAAALAAALPGTARAATPVVKIGYVDSFSGVFADVSMRHRAGLQIAVDEANRRGRVRYEVVTGDDNSKPATGATEARRLLTQEKVDVLLGGTISAVALAISPIAEETGVFFLPMNAQDSSLTGAKANRVTYRFTPNTTMLVNAISHRLLSVGNKWYFAVADYAFGHDGYKQLSTFLRKSHGTEAGMDTFPVGSGIDFSSLLTKIRNSDAEVLVVCQGGGQVTSMARQFVDFQMQKKMHFAGIILEDFYYKSLPLDQLAGSTFGMAWSPYASESAQRLAKMLGRTIAGPISSRHYHGYMVGSQVIDRLEAAGTTQAEALVDAFADHRFNAYKAHPAQWRAGDHQCVQDTYAATIVDSKTFAKQQFIAKIVAEVRGEDAAGPANPAAQAIIASQKIPARSDYQPKSLKA
jgi:branched-chain amino acid transport system substrate-binding protein